LITAPSLELKQIISPELAWKYQVVPKSVSSNQAEFYISKEANAEEVETILQAVLAKEVSLNAVGLEEITKVLNESYRLVKEEANRKSINVNSESFLEDLIHEALNMEASDIHIEAQEHNARIRFRIDGVLIEKYAVQKNLYPALINQIKIKSNLNISEKRLPQDGRILIKKKEFSVDLRVSVLPTLHGEKVVLRLLSKDATNIDLDTLGMDEKQHAEFIQAVKNPHGIILISGPTGSGKTTTLYATLKILNDSIRNIITIEDPIEYTLDGINQVQLRESIGLDFNAAIKTFLRQDPDIIMLGEIRDGQTANMAVRAALTGHLVFSTIHTNSAWGIITRLVDMDVPNFLLANTINMVIAQRLVRKLCNTCKQGTNESIDWPSNYKPPRKLAKHWKKTGCPECFHTGYRGRKAVYEIIPITKELQQNIRTNTFEITEYLKQKQIRTLSESAFELIENGETSFEEAMPIVLSESK